MALPQFVLGPFQIPEGRERPLFRGPSHKDPFSCHPACIPPQPRITFGIWSPQSLSVHWVREKVGVIEAKDEVLVPVFCLGPIGVKK